MLYTHFTEELLGLQGLKVTNIEKDEKRITICAGLERKSHTCPCCGTATRTVHDYRTQKIKDIPAFGKRFRNRILHIFSLKQLNKQAAA